MQDRSDQHLSKISTMWTMVRQAHAGQPEAVGPALQLLVERYSPAVYRYLLGALRDEEAASELFQEFALRLVRGDFQRAQPERGRFRDFLKTTLYHLVIDQQRKKKRLMLALEPAHEPAAFDLSTSESDLQFQEAWRTELMTRAWASLAEHERQTDQPWHTVLRYRTDHPEERSPDMAVSLEKTLGRAVTPVWIRKQLFLAREKMADLILDDVARYLENPTPEELAQELLEVGLLEYCKSALERR